MPRRLVPLIVLLGGCILRDPFSPAEERELDAMRSLWSRKGSANYTVESRISCFCNPAINYWTRLTVRNDVVVAIQTVDPMPPGWSSTPQEWSTVIQLFDQIERRARDHDSYLADLDVEYDPTSGYPRKVIVECTKNVSDCGSVQEMRNLVLN